MQLAPGTLVDGRYVIEGTLGQGGMAIVYRARHRTLGTLHAMKVLAASAQHVRDRMVREGQVQGALRHLNVVAVTDLVDVAGSPGLVMELIEGHPLEKVIAKAAEQQTRLPLEIVDGLAVGILRGVAHAHRHGFVHRDLKPANVLLQQTDEGFVPKVTDFGLAKILASEEDGLGTTRSGMVMGTPCYMAPEQIRDSKNVDKRADVFSLGVMLYELACGAKPFNGKDVVEIYTAVCSGKYRPIRELAPDIEPRMEKAIEGALVVDRQARIQDVDQLLAIWNPEVSTSRPAVARVGRPMPERFVPPPRNPEGENTFIDGGPTPQVEVRIDISQSEPVDLARMRIAPASDAPPAAAGGLASIDPSGNLADADDDVDFRPKTGRSVAIAVGVALVAGLLVAGAAAAVGLGLFAGSTGVASSTPAMAPATDAPTDAPATDPAASGAADATSAPATGSAATATDAGKPAPSAGTASSATTSSATTSSGTSAPSPATSSGTTSAPSGTTSAGTTSAPSGTAPSAKGTSSGGSSSPVPVEDVSGPAPSSGTSADAAPSEAPADGAHDIAAAYVPPGGAAPSADPTPVPELPPDPEPAPAKFHVSGLDPSQVRLVGGGGVYFAGKDVPAGDYDLQVKVGDAPFAVKGRITLAAGEDRALSCGDDGACQ